MLSIIRDAASRALYRYPTSLLSGLAVFCVLCVGDVATAQVQKHTATEGPHPKVAGFESFFNKAATEEDDDDLEEDYFDREIDELSAGLLLLGDLNCTSCHQAEENQRQFIHHKRAPILSKVGQRLQPRYYVNLLLSPHGTKPGTTMPDMFTGLNDQQRQTVATELAAFLASTSKPAEASPTKSLFNQGRQLFQTTGCLACHNPQEDDAKQLADSIPLGDLANKYTVPGLKEFLKNPLAVRPSARMPHFGLNDQEAMAIASYLLKSYVVEPNMRFTYYEGSWDKLPDFSGLKPVLEGETANFDVTGGKRRDNFAMVFRGFLQIEKDAKYKIFLSSDDGSRLLINGKQIVINDGVHPMTLKTGEAELDEGVHELTVEFFEAGGGEELEIEIEGGGLKRQSLGSFVTMNRETSQPETTDGEEQPLRFTDEMVVNGKEHFATYGCANCHELDQGGNIESELKAVSLKNFSDNYQTSGCLSKEPKPGIPDYSLANIQREALHTAIESLATDQVKFDEPVMIHQRMLALNCYACHERDEFGGVVRYRQDFFISNQQEMGDEGRLPPTLTGVGVKLRKDYLKNLLQKGAKDRPYMMTKMPGFGGQGGELADQLIQTDKLETGPAVVTEVSPRRLKTIGRKFAGEEGLSCIKCHKFGKHNATGIQAINMATMTKRLREDWFIEYMLDPNKFRPGTRMPESWRKGKTQFPDILEGDARAQIYSVWKFMEDGEKAAIPIGLQTATMELIPENEPLIYRNFIDGAGPRAIAVGYPGKVNLAFDANQMRLAMLWHGSFIDPSLHWNGRGQGFQGPMGENILRFDNAVSIAALADANADWPAESGKESGIRFRGYRFNDKRQPILLYQFDNLEIEDAFSPILPPRRDDEESYPEMRRKIVFAGKPSKTSFIRAAVGKEITSLGDDWYSIEDDWKLQIKSIGNPIIRDSKGRKELLIPVVFEENRSIAELIYQW